MIKKYKKKPVVIEAIQWNGSNDTEVMLFVGEELKASKPPYKMEYDKDIPNDAYYMTIPTLEGDMKASKLDFIIKGVSGEFYPCKPDIFEQTYEIVN